MAAEQHQEPPEPPPDIATELVDLTGLTLGDLNGIKRSSLGMALQRALERDRDPSDPVVAFKSGI